MLNSAVRAWDGCALVCSLKAGEGLGGTGPTGVVAGVAQW